MSENYTENFEIQNIFVKDLLSKASDFMSDERHELRKVMGRTDVLALAFGSMVGWGWVMLAGYWIEEAGVIGAIIAFLIGAVMCIFVGMVYAELTPALPLAGGELVFSYRGLGYTWAWITGWAIAFAYVSVAAWESIAIATAINYVFPIPRVGYIWDVAGYSVYFSWAIIGVIGTLVLSIVNHLGVKTSAIFQVMASVGLTLTGLIFIFGGITQGGVSNMAPAFTSGAGMVAVLLAVPSMFVGFDVIPQSAEEMNIPLKQIANVLIISILMAAFWYIIMILGISLNAPPEVRNAATIPIADSLAYAFNSPLFGKIMIAGGLCGILTSWNGFMLGGTRVIFAMGRAKMLPPVFGKVHPKYQTPTAAIVLVGFLCVLSPLLGKNALVWFVDAGAFGTVVAYLMVSASFIMIRKKEPNLARPYKVKNSIIVGGGAIFTGLFFLFMYSPIVPSGGLIWPQEWGLVILWFTMGTVLAGLSNRSYSDVSDAEREMLMFGEEYARKEIIDNKE